MHRSIPVLILVVLGCGVSVACGGSSPPPTDPSGPATTGSTTPESGSGGGSDSDSHPDNTVAPDNPQK